MGTNKKQFAKELDVEVKRVVATFIVFHREVVIDVIFNIIRRSPVWTGRFRANHNVSIGRPDNELIPAHPQVLAGAIRWPQKPSSLISSPALTKANARLVTLPLFAKVFITNPLPYAAALEDGTATRPPLKIYALAIVSADQRFRNVTKVGIR